MIYKIAYLLVAILSLIEAQELTEYLNHTDFSLEQRSCVSLQIGREYLRYSLSKVITRYVSEYMDSKPRLEMPGSNTTQLQFNGTSANVFLTPIHELGAFHMMKSPNVKNNKAKVEVTLPAILKLAPRDLYDEDSTQDYMPGLDIIDAQEYFEY